MSEINKICQECTHNFELQSKNCTECVVDKFNKFFTMSGHDRNNRKNNFEPRPQQAKLTKEDVEKWISGIQISNGARMVREIIEKGIELGYIEPKKKSATEELKTIGNMDSVSDKEFREMVIKSISELESKLNERG